jgi:uncharacterized protein (TIGR03437 family)
MKINWCIWLALAGAAALPAAGVPAYGIQTVAGSSFIGDGGPATAAQIGSVQGVAVDGKGNLYLSDTDNNRVRKVDTTGTISTFAGNGTAGFSGDGGAATAAQLNLPYGLAADVAGNLYIADLGNNRVRKVSLDGTITTIAGTGVEGYSGDGVQATAAQLYVPRNLAFDGAGNLYIAEFGGHRVRRVTPAGIIATAVGNGIAGYSGDHGFASQAQLSYPAGLTVDRTGALYVADSGNNCVRKILPNGVISTVLGGTNAIVLATPTAVAVDASLTIYASEYASPIVHAYTAAAVWAYLAGTGAPGFAGDGGAATKAELMMAPHDLAVGPMGDIYIADGRRVRRVNTAGIISTVAGDAFRSTIGDGAGATSAILYHPSAVALDASGNLFIADTGTERVRMVTAAGMISTVAGNGTAGYNGDDVLGTAAELWSPMGLAMDPSNDLFVADSDNERVRYIAAGMIYPFAGTGTGAPLAGPRGVCIGGDGSVYIVDSGNNRVLVVPPGGVAATFAGNGSQGAVGDGGQARFAQLNGPTACTVDRAGNFYLADTGNHRVRKITPTGAIAAMAGNGGAGYSGDGGAAPSAALYGPTGVAVDGNGNVFIADTGNHAIRLVTPDGLIHTIAGQGSPGFAGDGGTALSAFLNSPAGIALDGAVNLYFADAGNNRVRRMTPSTDIVTVDPVSPSLALVSAASLIEGSVAPGEIVTIYGLGIGPATGVSGPLDASGRVPSLLGGAQVAFDGVAAPLFYAQATQINAQVPYTIAGENFTRIDVYYQGQLAGTLNLAVAPSVPGLFAVAFNQDGSLNSASAPAARGSVVTFVGSGEGLTNGPNVAGLAAVAPYPAPTLPVTLTVDGIAAQLLYAGEAPAYCGLLQVNAIMPGGLIPSGAEPVQLVVGVAVSPTITVWLE